VPLLPSTLAWGAAGHEIVATIAQIHLHPSVKEKLCTILPAQAKCHLAPVAAWADQVRTRYPGTGPMHYINGECEAGATSWVVGGLPARRRGRGNMMEVVDDDAGGNETRDLAGCRVDAQTRENDHCDCHTRSSLRS
jgi:hypothetical protein